MPARVTRDGIIYVAYLTISMEPTSLTLITGKGIQLRSPTPIMAPGPHEYNYGKTFVCFFDLF